MRNDKDQLKRNIETRKAIQSRLTQQMVEMKGLNSVETLSITFEKMSQDRVINKIAYFNSSPQPVINITDFKDNLMISGQDIQNKIATLISEGSGWTIKSVYGQWINILQYNPLKGSSYIQLPSELRNSTKGLINNSRSFFQVRF